MGLKREDDFTHTLPRRWKGFAPGQETPMYPLLCRSGSQNAVLGLRKQNMSM